MEEILENKTNYLILKEYNFIKLYSYKSLVSIYNIETKTFNDLPYTFKNIDGTFSNYSVTTTRHQIKFKNYIINMGLWYEKL